MIPTARVELEPELFAILKAKPLLPVRPDPGLAGAVRFYRAIS